MRRRQPWGRRPRPPPRPRRCCWRWRQRLSASRCGAQRRHPVAKAAVRRSRLIDALAPALTSAATRCASLSFAHFASKSARSKQSLVSTPCAPSVSGSCALGLLLARPCLRLQQPLQVPRRAPRRAIRCRRAAHELPPPHRRFGAGEAQQRTLLAWQRQRCGASHSRALGACNSKVAGCGERVANTRVRAHVASAHVQIQSPEKACTPPTTACRPESAGVTAGRRRGARCERHSLPPCAHAALNSARPRVLKPQGADVLVPAPRRAA